MVVVIDRWSLFKFPIYFSMNLNMFFLSLSFLRVFLSERSSSRVTSFFSLKEVKWIENTF
jgi:hypothetical protein